MGVLLFASSLLLGGCNKEAEDTGEPPEVTWADDVAPILYRSCMGCHLGESVWDMDGIGHFPLETYTDAEAVSIYIQQVALSQRMPPWPGGASCDGRPTFLDDPSLSESDRLTILEWTEADLAMGDVNNAPEIPAEIDPSLEGQTHALFPSEDTQPSFTQDGYPCSLLDPELDTDHWMTGLQGIPDNRPLVSSMVAWLVPPERVTEIQSLANGEQSFRCFGLEPAEGLELLGSWSPGAAPFETPTGSGIPMPAGSQVLLRTHHHVWQGDAVQPDRSGIGLRLSESAPEKEAHLYAIGNADSGPELVQQDGESTPTFLVGTDKPHWEEMRFSPTAEQADGEIWAVGGWMHHSGVKLDLEVAGPEGSQCLLAMENWRSDWMRLYRYDPSQGLPTWDAQSALTVRCSYENSIHNEDLMAALDELGQSSPVPMGIGQSGTDEACLSLIGILQPAP